MADFKSPLRVRGHIQDADSYDSTTEGFLMVGQNGTTNYQSLLVDANGELQVDIQDISAGTQTNDVKVTLDSEEVVLGTGTNTIGSVKLTDGTDVLDVLVQDAAFGTASKGLGVFGKYEATPTTYADGDAVPISMTSDGKVKIDTTGLTVEVNLDNANDDVLVYGWDGSSNQKIKTDVAGELQVDIQDISAGTQTNDVKVTLDSEEVVLAAGTNIAGKVYITDGTDDVDVATDGSAAKTKGFQVLGTDGTNAQILKTDTAGQLYVISSEADATEVFTYATTNLVKDTVTTVASYSPSSGTDTFDGFLVSGSGYMKVEVFWGVTTSEVQYVTLFNSPSNPNVIYNFPAQATPDIASTDTILIKCTNLETAASPASDFSGYATIISHQ